MTDSLSSVVDNLSHVSEEDDFGYTYIGEWCNESLVKAEIAEIEDAFMCLLLTANVLPGSASSNKQTTNTCASLVPLNFIPNFGSTVKREQHILPCQDVSAVPLNPSPDFNHVHIELSPTTRRDGAMKVDSYFKSK
ncbi:hypothetical protein YC2023_009323 [Brassica napus]